MRNRLAVPAAVLAVLALLGAGPVQAAGGDPGAAQAKQEPQAPARRKPTDAASYVMVDALTASILVDSRPRGLMVVEICLDVPDAALRKEAESGMPRLLDAYTAALGRYGATTAHPNRAPDAAHVATLLQSETDRVLGKPGARVLMANLIVRTRR